MSNAQMERNKTKEQLEEEKKISLSFRIKPLEMDGLSADALRTKATELWETIVKLETEKYDLEERQKRQDYDVSSICRLSRHFFFWIVLITPLYFYSWKSWRKDRSSSWDTKHLKRVWTQKLSPENTR